MIDIECMEENIFCSAEFRLLENNATLHGLLYRLIIIMLQKHTVCRPNTG